MKIIVPNSEANSGSSVSAKIQYGDTTASMGFESIENNNYFTYTIQNVTSDLTDIVITVTNWEVNIPTYTDYEEPDKEMTDSQNVENITLTKNNNWTYSKDELPKIDNDGNPYYYTVVENSVKQNGQNISGRYTTTYSNNDGIQEGQIVITNQENSNSYELPKTGGSGAWIYRFLGMAIVAAGIGILAFRRRRGQNL